MTIGRVGRESTGEGEFAWLIDDEFEFFDSGSGACDRGWGGGSVEVWLFSKIDFGRCFFGIDDDDAVRNRAVVAEDNFDFPADGDVVSGGSFGEAVEVHAVVAFIKSGNDVQGGFLLLWGLCEEDRSGESAVGFDGVAVRRFFLGVFFRDEAGGEKDAGEENGGERGVHVVSGSGCSEKKTGIRSICDDTTDPR